MTVQYILDVETFNNMVEEREIEGLEKTDIDRYAYIEVNVDFLQNNVSVWGCANGSADFFGDYVTVDLDSLEYECKSKDIEDNYVDNIEIVDYLQAFGIPYDWALDAIDEWRTPEQEEEEVNVKGFWEAMDAIKTAYKISREEN